MNKSDSTEEKILEAARKVFLAKGMDGARMQEIADEAGINKALLHYYFRSKEKLFNAIFRSSIGLILPRIAEGFALEKDPARKFGLVIDNYLDMIIENPFIPGFILKEIHRDPDALVAFMKKNGANPQVVFNELSKMMDAGEIVRMNPVHLVISVLGMCVFPFAARPLLQRIGFGNDAAAYDQFLNERKTEVKQFVLKAILP